MRGSLETETTGRKIIIISKNFVEKDEFRFFTTERERMTVKEMKQRGVGGPLLRTEFESEILKFFKRGNRSRRRRVPDRGTVF